MELNEFLQGLRVAAHVLTVFLIAGYCPRPDSDKRPAVSWFAVMLAGLSACLAVSRGRNWHQWLALPLPGTLRLAIIFCLFLMPLIAGRGNVATLFPRKVWSHRP